MNLYSVAITKLVKLANDGHELLSVTDDAVTLTKGDRIAVIDRFGRVSWFDKQDKDGE